MADQIEVKNVSFEYTVDSGRVLAIKDINFSVRQSEFLCLLGPSGCGKTTILNILAGLLHPTSGEIRIGDAPLDSNRQNRGVVFQDFAQLFPWRTARHNVEFGLEMRKVDKATREKTALEFLRLVGLEKFADVFPHQLSGGMQQRVAIARSLAYNPQVLLMDEPFAALDAMTRDDMQQLLTDVWQKTKKTIVYITHNVVGGGLSRRQGDRAQRPSGNDQGRVDARLAAAARSVERELRGDAARNHGPIAFTLTGGRHA